MLLKKLQFSRRHKLFTFCTTVGDYPSTTLSTLIHVTSWIQKKWNRALIQHALGMGQKKVSPWLEHPQEKKNHLLHKISSGSTHKMQNSSSMPASYFKMTVTKLRCAIGCVAEKICMLLRFSKTILLNIGLSQTPIKLIMVLIHVSGM